MPTVIHTIDLFRNFVSHRQESPIRQAQCDAFGSFIKRLRILPGFKRSGFTTSLIIAALFILLSVQAFAQQNPSGIDWKYIDAGNYRIIFPAGLEDTANRTANLLLYYEKYNYRSLSTEPAYIPVVIIDDYSEANGFVASAPFYSHWFTTPSSFASMDWFTGLAIHEGRHMVQFNKLREGQGKNAWYILFGNFGTAIFTGLYIPPWFLEGDAVVMETALTRGGRGRLPYFSLWYRGVEMSGERYSYYRSFLGTYDDNFPYPSNYSLGYIICSYVRKHYGRDAWDRIINNTGNYVIFSTFDRSVKTETGKNIREIYSAAMDEYRSLWTGNLDGIEFTGSTPLSPDHGNTWESYLFPLAYGDETLALRFSRKKTLSLVKIKPGGKIVDLKLMPYDLLAPFSAGERGFSAGGDYILWRETKPDPRWGYRSYSNLVLYNISTGDTTDLTRKGKFIASAISPDGSIISGIEYASSGGYTLNIFNTGDMSVISSVKLNGYGHVFDHAISPDNRYIAMPAFDKRGNAILLFDTQTGKTENITGYTTAERMKSPVFYGRYLFYVSDYTGIDNIYAIDTKTGKRFQVSSVRLGAYYPDVSVKDESLVFNEYTVSGFRAVSMKIDPGKWIPVEKLKPYDDPFIGVITGQELDPDMKVPEDVPDEKHGARDYNTLTDGMAVFGWIPFFDATTSNFYFTLMLKDVLQTLSASASYIYNYNENTHAGAGRLIYKGLYPVLDITGSYGRRAIRIKDKLPQGVNRYITWNETNASGGMSIPLNFSGGIHAVYLKIGADSGIIRLYDKNHEDYSIYESMNRDGNLGYVKYIFEFSHKITGALNARIPRFGEILKVSYSHTPWNTDYKGRLFSSGAEVYLPSCFDTHGFKLGTTYEFNDYDNYVFPQVFRFTRGYDSVIYRHFVCGSIDYMFPILDFSLPLWKLVYIKRINGSLFADYGEGLQYGKSEKYSSAGVELTSVQNLLSNPYLLIEAGVRYSRCFETGENAWEAIITVPLL